MKNLLFILLSCFLLIGCSVKKEVSVSNKTYNKGQSNSFENARNINPFEKSEVQEESIISNLSSDTKRIAIIYPSTVVGRYAKSTMSTISAFLIFNNTKFELESFDTYDEKRENVITQVEALKDRGFDKVVALFTKDGFDILNTMGDIQGIKFYFPLINKNEVMTFNSNFIFGGISYEKQVALLQKLSSGKNSMFYVKSYLGDKLKKIYESSFANPGAIIEIERQNNKYKVIMEDERIAGSTVVLNTPIVKTSIILTQLTAYEVMPAKVLSTQLNYNPLLIKLTQAKDRENFYVVSSINKVDSFIEDYSNLLGANVAYEWVDYSTLIGVNYLINKNESLVIKTKIIDNQADYEETLYKSTIYGFEKVLTN
ncbi:hypothetical protein CRV08_10515 [Halarcobacter ebronensis]|uniref:Uncharacterized protein n=1 Tax=Halarcobacter ebronensis TaxID=1462615 RepID=A0A4Q0YAR6_9BACT|nr:hypothetical protein [Halarcobacter ebronensis]RXJ67352.1 hypothetical protein CRV08_10515 [Halarcobacter ebronensis]